MKRLITFIMLGILVIGVVFSNGYVYADSVDNFISIRLTSPVKSNEVVHLYGEEGFLIFNKRNLTDYLEYITEEKIKVKIVDGKSIAIFDMEDNLIYSYKQEDELILTSSNYRNVQVEDKNYRDFIEFKIIDGRLLIINYVDLENYLYGVVPREMPAYFEMEALKSQAIASRTYALKNLNKHSSQGFDLCDTIHCQVYGGMDGEHERSNWAVDETRGMILTYNGSIIDALYHSNSGGITEDSSDAWGYSHPYLISVEDRFSTDAPNSNWTYNLSTDEVKTKLSNHGIYIGSILDMEIIDTTSSGRVKKLKIIGSLGEKVLNKGEIREVFGLNEIKSNLFTVKKDFKGSTRSLVYAIDGEGLAPQLVDLNNVSVIDGNLKQRSSRGLISRFINKNGIVDRELPQGVDNFIIEGKGYGHGVGMSQWGAQRMAEEGYSFEDILKYYYSGVDITTNNR